MLYPIKTTIEDTNIIQSVVKNVCQLCPQPKFGKEASILFVDKISPG